MIGTTLSHYRIVSELGRGGMGVVTWLSTIGTVVYSNWRALLAD